MLARLLGLEGRNIENPSYVLTDPSAADYLIGGTNTSAGVRVTHDTALQYAPVWQAVSMISGDVAKLPLCVFRRVDDDGREKAKTHQAWRLVRHEPGPNRSAYSFWRQLVADMLLWGNAYAYISSSDSSGGRPEQLIPLLPDRTKPSVEMGRQYYVSEIGGELWSFNADQVLHFRGLSLTRDVHKWQSRLAAGCGQAVDFVAAARDSIGLGLAAEGFASKYFKHGARTAGILELPAGMSKRARDTIEEGFAKHHEGADNWFKTVILREGAKFHQTSVNARDSQTHELREDQVRDIARFFNLAPSRLGLSDSVSYNSKSEDNQSYLDTTLSPHLETIASECWLKLLTPRQKERDSHYFEHLTGALLRLNQVERSNVYHNAILDGWMSRNEARRRENMPALDGLDDMLQPANMLPAGEQPPEPEEMPDSSRSDPPGDVYELRRVNYRLAAKMREKAAAGPGAFCQWIDADLFYYRNLLAESGLDGSQHLAGVTERLNLIAERATAADLAAEVGEYAEELERSV